MAFKKITSSFSAAPQLTRNDVAAAAQAGYHSIISSRPDGEEPGQPSAHEMARIAEEHGLGFAHVPIVPGKATDADADRMKEALVLLGRLDGPAVVRPPLMKLTETEIARIAEAMSLAGIGRDGAEGLCPAAVAAE